MIASIRTLYVAGGSPGEFDDEMAELTEGMGFDLHEDFAATLGPYATLYHAPSEGPLGLNATMILGVKDNERLHETLEIIAEAWMQSDETTFVERRKLLGAKIWIAGFRGGLSPNPTFALTDEALVINFLSPAPVAQFLRLQCGEGKRWQPPESLRTMVKQAKGQVTGVSYLDAAPLARIAVTSTPLLVSMLRNAYPKLSVDMVDFPDPEAVAAPLFPAISVHTVDKEGLHYRCDSPLPLVGAGIIEMTLTSWLTVPYMLSMAF